MSSGSDQDDFFDAADETPFDSFIQSKSPKSVTSQSLSEIEDEERRLRQLKKKTEERRRREDEELERRLNQLQRKRFDTENEEADWHAQEHEIRHKKLEEMRQALGTTDRGAGDRSGCSTMSHDSSVENDSPNTSTDIPDIFALSSAASASSTRGLNGTTPKSHTIEKMESNGVGPNPSYRHHAKKRSGSWGDLPKNNSDIKVTNTSATPQAALPSDGDEAATGSIPSAAAAGFDAKARRDSRMLASRGSDAGLKATSQENKLSDLDLNMDRYQPEKEKQNKSLTLLITGSKLGDADISSHSVVDTILQQTQVHEDSEPDIVKSTKSQRTPPSTLKPPQAPPRRKKARQLSSQATLCPSANDQLPSLPSPILGHRAPPSPNLGKDSLGRDNTLDIRSALEGVRHIHAQDADNSPSKQLKQQEENALSVSAAATATATTTTTTTAPSASAAAASSSSKVSSLSRSGSTSSSPYHTMDENVASLTRQIQEWQHLKEGEREASPNRRPRSNSGRILSDEEILELVTVRNLDTGEMITLSTAEDKLPKCVNPLALHIMRRTKEYSSDTSLHIEGLSDESDSRSEKSVASSSNNVRNKRLKIRKLFGKTVSKVKTAADQALHSDQGPVEEEVSVNGKILKIKSSSKNKGPYDFSQPNILQELWGEHSGAIWTMKFSPCGKLLATGGQDSVLRIWVLKSCYTYFEDFRQKYSDVRLSPAESHESLNSASSDISAANMDPLKELNPQAEEDEITAPFKRRPFCIYKGHTADLLDLSWSKNYFILSSSMDKTVRLWHISRRECLCTFQHIDFVTAIVFHPKDDRYFLSGSLDGKLRLWNIPDKKVTLWNELSGASTLITTANFCYNGRLAVVGTYDGKCIFYTTDQLKYYTMVNVRSTRGKNSKGRKITGIETMPGEEKILVTSNDSRIRLYNLKDLTLSCKYKGGTNNSSQIRASFSPTGKYIVCGSEDHFLYVWKTHHEFIKFTSARRDRNDYWEAIKIHNAVVTSAIFAPNPSFIFRMAEQESMDLKGQTYLMEDDTEEREIIISADFTGAIKVMTNRPNRT